ncbi:MAG: HAD hydrolase-like protein [Candidatus Methanomethylophilaceae archaeon]
MVSFISMFPYSPVMTTRLAVFDLDGTIADSKEGIFFSYRHTAEVLGKPEPSIESLNASLGGPLPENMKKLFDLDDDMVSEAVSIYRDEYSRKGETLVKPFPGIIATIERIRAMGVRVAVATLKMDRFAFGLLDDWGIAWMFHSIHGANEDDELSKSDLIGWCMSDAGVSPEETVMIGDSMDDLEAARECGIRFIGASYGFSLPKEKCMEEGVDSAESPADLADLIVQ